MSYTFLLGNDTYKKGINKYATKLILGKLSTMKQARSKPGFTRVYIPERKRTLLIRDFRARDKAFMIKHGMVLMPEPQIPVTIAPVTPLAPNPGTMLLKPEQNGEPQEPMTYTEPSPVITKKPTTKSKTNG